MESKALEARVVFVFFSMSKIISFAISCEINDFGHFAALWVIAQNRSFRVKWNIWQGRTWRRKVCRNFASPAKIIKKLFPFALNNFFLSGHRLFHFSSNCSQFIDLFLLYYLISIADHVISSRLIDWLGWHTSYLQLRVINKESEQSV